MLILEFWLSASYRTMGAMLDPGSRTCPSRVKLQFLFVEDPCDNITELAPCHSSTLQESTSLLPSHFVLLLHHQFSFFTSGKSNHIELGYKKILTLAPKLLGGRLWTKRARTTPEFPCGRVTLPQMTRILLPCRSLLAR